jgi:proline racemase
MEHIDVIDSHTAGEPTRVVVAGAPALRGATLAAQRADFIERHDAFRRTVACEPRGNDTIVGALLLPPASPDAAAGVIFFNNVGAIGMCGHGTIGLVRTLAHLGRIAPGRHRIETPVGPVEAVLHDDGRVSVVNVPSWRHAAGVVVDVEGLGPVRGDVAWGGNWFFLVDRESLRGVPPLAAANLEALTAATRRIRQGLEAQGVTGADGGLIDHIELYDHAAGPGANARNFVLCPGLAYDRSPCGTGTSAKLACLAADGAWPAGQAWVQESVIGSRFEASWQPLEGGRIRPTITGRAWITGETRLVREADDPFRDGIA